MKRVLLASAVILGSSTFANGATVSVLPTDGSGDFQKPANLVVDVLDSKDAERDVDKERQNAQTFTITEATTIDQLAINFRNGQDGNATPTTFQFFKVSDALAGTLTPDGAIIDTYNLTFADLGGQSEGTLVFDVTDTSASAGDAFAIRFLTSGTSSEHIIKWAFTDDYSGGVHYENDSSSNRDYSFGVVAVPEPASLLLMGLGGLLIAPCRRRRA